MHFGACALPRYMHDGHMAIRPNRKGKTTMIKWQRDFAGSYTSECGKYNILHNEAGAWNIGHRVMTHWGEAAYEYHDACNTLACAKSCAENTHGQKEKPVPALSAMLNFGG